MFRSKHTDAPAPLICLTAGAAALLLLAGCASTDGHRQAERSPEAVSLLLKQQGDELYTATQRCLPMNDYRVEVIDDGHLLFRDRDELWVNELRVRCPGLGGPFDALAFEKTGPRLCELDQVSDVDRTMFWWRTGVPCPLGKFRKIDTDRMDAVLGGN